MNVVTRLLMNFRGFMVAVAVGLLLLHPTMSLFECGVYDYPNKEKLARCVEVVEILEEALLSDKANLLTLRDAFLSGSYPPPSLLGVTYQISGDVQNSIEVHWSSSRVFTMIDPTLIHALQPGVLTMIYYIEGISFLRTITLYLDVQPKKHFSENEYNYAIVFITERLRAYAIHQKPLTEWDGHDKGFVIFSTSWSFSKKVITYALIPTATVLLLIAGIASSFKLVTKLSNLDRSYQAHVKISLFWSFISVLHFTNFIEAAVQLLLAIFPALETNRVISIIKVVAIFIVGAFGGCVGDLCDKRKLPPNPSSRKLCGPSKQDLDHCKALCNIFLLVFFVSTGFISTAALFFVHPVLILSTVAYICTSIFCMAVVLALPSSFGMIISKWETQRNDREFKKNCLYMCDYILYMILIIVGNLLMLVFLTVLSNADYTYTTDIFQDASSFLPSVILGLIGYVAKKKLTAKSKEKLRMSENDLEVELEQTREGRSLKLVEEGKATTNSNDEDNTHETIKLLPSVEETEL